MFCTRCGAENSEDAVFCRKCGNNLGTEEAREAQAGQEERSVPPSPPGKVAQPDQAVASQPGPPVEGDRSGQAAQAGTGEQTPADIPVPPPPTAVVKPWMAPPRPVYPGYVVPRSDGLCIAGMVLGIIGLVLFWVPYVAIPCGILAIIFGAIGIRNVQQSPQTKTGQGMGVAGLVTGILAFLGGIFMVIVYVSVTTW